MQTEIASHTILAQMKIASGVSFGQLRLWLEPQKAEHNSDYDVNQKYFGTLLGKTLNHLHKGYIASSVHDSVEDGDAYAFSLTQKGSKYIQEFEDFDE
jgi:hypothetical protein